LVFVVGGYVTDPLIQGVLIETITLVKTLGPNSAGETGTSQGDLGGVLVSAHDRADRVANEANDQVNVVARNMEGVKYVIELGCLGHDGVVSDCALGGGEGDGRFLEGPAVGGGQGLVRGVRYAFLDEAPYSNSQYLARQFTDGFFSPL
jgi:hypothetical protein